MLAVDIKLDLEQDGKTNEEILNNYIAQRKAQQESEISGGEAIASKRPKHD